MAGIKIIVLEGPDGCGKSTTALAIKDLIQGTGKTCILLRAPGATPLGERLREILLDPNIEASPEELALMFASALASVTRQAKELADQDVYVILDRWIYSMLVYQGEAGVAANKLEAVVAMFMPNIRAYTKCFLLSVPFAVCKSRIQEAAERGQDRFEGEGERIAKSRWMAYEAFSDTELTRVAATTTPEKIAADILKRCGIGLVGIQS